MAKACQSTSKSYIYFETKKHKDQEISEYILPIDENQVEFSVTQLESFIAEIEVTKKYIIKILIP